MSDKDKETITPPLTQEAHLNKLQALALKQAEKELEAGTASSQVLTQFLRLATERERVELEKLKLENELKRAQIEAIASQQKVEEMYNGVLEALRSYSINPDYDPEDFYE